MTRRDTLKAAAALAVAVALNACAADDAKLAETSPDIMVRPSAVPFITEDDPRWDCRTMGNLQCGNIQYHPEGDLDGDGEIEPCAQEVLGKFERLGKAENDALLAAEICITIKARYDERELEYNK